MAAPSAKDSSSQHPKQPSPSGAETSNATKAAAASSVDPSCLPCVKMLQQILASSASRPRQILQALASSRHLAWRPTPDGVQVQIPAAGNSLSQRSWTEVVAESKKDDMSSSAHGLNDKMGNPLTCPTLQATSAVVAAKDHHNQTTTSSHDDDNNKNQPLEWMQIVCKPCSNKGPEGGARAFVMGPTPLSMVICTNRLQSSSPTSRQAEMEEILTHEFMHVFDVRRFRLDLRSCENLAFSEVRAARQAECASSWTPQMCARLKATTATQNLFPTQGAACIRKVFGEAYHETRPLGQQPARDTARRNHPSPSSR